MHLFLSTFHIQCFLELAHLKYYVSQVRRFKIIDSLEYNRIKSFRLNSLGPLGGQGFIRIVSDGPAIIRASLGQGLRIYGPRWLIARLDIAFLEI